MVKIKSIKAREILNSKGSPTVEVFLETDLGDFSASVPSGVSTGKYEALELKDEDGRGVKLAIENIEKIIAPALKKENFKDQKKLDNTLIDLDGTESKSNLGANAILPVSMAMCRAIAASKDLSLYRYISQLAGAEPKLPKPSFNMIEGGKHAKGSLAFQEFMIVPQKDMFQENLTIGKEVYESLGRILKERYGGREVRLSQEGAFATQIEKITDALDVILEAAESAGYKEKILFAIDAAASEFYKGEFYSVDGKQFSKKELLEFYEELTESYPFISIEDPLFEEDFEGFALLNSAIGKRIIIIGDDLTVSNVERIETAEENKSCSGLLLKPNQIGTVTEAILAGKLAKSYDWKIMVSNRGGETKDDFIADLAVGIGAEFIKSGAPFPKERMAKYNRLVKIEEELCLN